MFLSGRTKLDELLKRYPFLLAFLISLSPAYSRLKNPLLRKALGKLATLDQVAATGKMPLPALLEALGAEIARQTGEEVKIEGGGEPAGWPAPPEGKEKSREEKIEALKEIIKELHAGGDPRVLKKKFAELVKDVSAGEIAEMEQRLIAEGMPEEEVKRLCDVHVLIFQESLEEAPARSYVPGHPLHTLSLENREAEKILAAIEAVIKTLGQPPASEVFEKSKAPLENLVENLAAIEKHYLKKENQLFPRLEERGVSGPTKVMWAIHDDIRNQLKQARALLRDGKAADFLAVVQDLIQKIRDMIYKEEKILFPLSLETLDEADWAGVKKGETEIGYAWVVPGREWEPRIAPREVRIAYSRGVVEEPAFDLDVGRLTGAQVNALLKHLPVDITFVDENDTVRYYSATKERIFPRSPGVIGRKVQNCHPPKSVHIVNQILQAFKNGQRDMAEFWFPKEASFIHIRYFVVRDDAGKYLGCLEVSQEVSSIKRLTGERRLLDWS